MVTNTCKALGSNTTKRGVTGRGEMDRGGRKGDRDGEGDRE